MQALFSKLLFSLLNPQPKLVHEGLGLVVTLKMRSVFSETIAYLLVTTTILMCFGNKDAMTTSGTLILEKLADKGASGLCLVCPKAKQVRTNSHGLVLF